MSRDRSAIEQGLTYATRNPARSFCPLLFPQYPWTTTTTTLSAIQSETLNTTIFANGLSILSTSSFLIILLRGSSKRIHRAILTTIKGHMMYLSSIVLTQPFSCHFTLEFPLLNSLDIILCSSKWNLIPTSYRYHPRTA